MSARLVPIAALLMLGSMACSKAIRPEATSPPQGPSPYQEATAAPFGQPLLKGLPQVEVLGPPESGAGEVPVFSWESVEGAATYDLVVLGPDGPLWAWQGKETEVALGALPFERPPGMGGPVIAAGSCWSVIALNADGHVVAASDFLPVSPAESIGHICVPGSGGQ